MRILRVSVLLALAAAAAACGQKGPLVLPDAHHPRKKVRLPTAPKLPLGSPATAPSEPPAAAPERSAPAGPAAESAPPEAAPETNSTPNPAPQA
jgi:predicted small lipoprotein YifL